MDKIAIIGAGLAGTLCALYLARRGYTVDVYELRSDMRHGLADYGRSINLALSCRGITGLHAMNLMADVQKIMVPMRARAIHELDETVHYQPFGRHPDEYINAISRTDLNVLLLNTAEHTKNINLHFKMKLLDVDLHNKILYFDKEQKQRVQVTYDRLIGADGAPSQLRDNLVQKKIINAKRIFLNHGYKELSISKHHTHNMIREHLHLWPRNSFMMLGNPNPDDSITGSLFLAHEGPKSFATITNPQQLNAFFAYEFPDAFKVMPHLVDEFFANPVGTMSTIYCDPWFVKDSCLLLGDAAHGVIPFFGQGMNSAFEDCRILDELLTNYRDNWGQVMPLFYQQRKPNTDAVAKMSIDNYHEIHSDIRNKHFLLKKQIEQALMKRYPKRYISKHVLVMFTNTPYKTALAHGFIQNEFLEHLSHCTDTVANINWQEVDILMNEYDKKLANLG